TSVTRSSSRTDVESQRAKAYTTAVVANHDPDYHRSRFAWGDKLVSTRVRLIRCVHPCARLRQSGAVGVPRDPNHLSLALEQPAFELKVEISLGTTAGSRDGVTIF